MVVKLRPPASRLRLTAGVQRVPFDSHKRMGKEMWVFLEVEPIALLVEKFITLDERANRVAGKEG